MHHVNEGDVYRDAKSFVAHTRSMFRPWRIALHDPEDSSSPPSALSEHRRWRDAYDAAHEARLQLAATNAVIVMEWLTTGWVVRDILPPLTASDLADGGRKEVVRTADGEPFAAVEICGRRHWLVYMHRGHNRFELPDRFRDASHVTRSAAVNAAEELSGSAAINNPVRPASTTSSQWARLLDPFDPVTAVDGAGELTVNVTKAFDDISSYLEQMALPTSSEMTSWSIGDVVPARTWAGLYATDMLPETVDHMITTIRRIFDDHYPSALHRGDIDLISQDSRPYRVIGEPAQTPRHLDVVAMLLTDGLNGADVDTRRYMAAVPPDERFDLIIGTWHYYAAILAVVRTMTGREDE